MSESADLKESPKVMNRWIVVIGAILIQLALGTIYCWGTATKVVTPFIGSESTVSVFIFGIGLLSFAITMIFAGQLQQKIGPMKTAILGGILVGVGVMLSAAMKDSLIGMMFTYGIVFGAGIGFAYVCPIATAAKWFPDKKGLINGIAVAGFGAGAFIFNFVIKGLSNPEALETINPDYNSTVIARAPIMFIVLGIIYVVMIVLGALTLKVPPEGWKPANWNPPAAESGISSGLQIPRSEAVKTPTFWVLWSMFVLSAISGLMILGSYANFAKTTDIVEEIEVFRYVIGATDFVLLGSIMALFNGLGRIVWGKMADVLNYKKSMLLMFGTQGVLMLVYFFTNGNNAFFWIISCALVFCFGGNFSLFPTATTDLFGAKNLGSNYGIVFTAYGIAGFLGATMVNQFVNAFGSYLVLFIVMGVMSLIAAGLTFVIKPPQKS